MCDLFGGVSSAQTGLYQAQSNWSNTMQSIFNSQYKTQQQTLGQLQSLTRQLQLGQTGPGFGGAQNAAYIAGIQNQAAAAARDAIQQQRSIGAGSQIVSGGQVSGGGPGLTRQAGIAAQSAATTTGIIGAQAANALNRELAANYEQGRTNAQDAASMLTSQYTMENPLQYGQMYQAGLDTQWSEEKQMMQERQAAAQAKIGMAMKGALTAATFGAGGIGALGAGEGFGTGLMDFMAGGANEAFGTNFGISGPSAPSAH
jgi:hypothetical protein